MSTIGNAFRAVFPPIAKEAGFKPQHVIAAGLVAAAAFVLILFGIVQLVTR